MEKISCHYLSEKELWKMKRVLALLVAGAVVVLIPASCIAKVPDAQISLGGIVPGVTLNSVKAIYGEPVQSRDGETWIFSNGMVIKVDDDFPEIVEEVVVYSANGKIATTAGIAVGMKDTALNVAYGSADEVEYEYDGVEYTYYSDDMNKKMEFKVKDNVVVKIKCEFRG